MSIKNESLARGIAQSAAGDTHDLGDFTQYAPTLDVAELIADFEDAYADAMVREPGDKGIDEEAHTVALVRTVRSAIAKARSEALELAASIADGFGIIGARATDYDYWGGCNDTSVKITAAIREASYETGEVVE